MSAGLPLRATADVPSPAAAIAGVDILNAYPAGAARVQPSEIDGPIRDLRLDACRGLALWFMFVDHIPHNIISWLTLRNYGFADATEVFVFVSGYTCMVAYGDVLRRQGWLAAMVHAVRRGCQIYIAFLVLLVAYLVLVEALGGGVYLDATNTAVFFERPATAIVRASMMQYTPVNTDVLPIFVLFHLTFPILLWLFARNTSIALTLSAPALSVSPDFWLQPAGVAARRMVLQSAGVADALCVRHLGCKDGFGEIVDMGAIARRADSFNFVSGIQPDRRIELANKRA